MNNLLVFSPIIFPLIGAALALSSRYLPPKGPGRHLEALGALVGFGLSWGALGLLVPELWGGRVLQGVVGGWNPELGILYRFDVVTWVLNFLGLGTGTAAWVYSRTTGPKGAHFTGVFLIQSGALAATAMTADIFNLFVCLELLGLASYVLVAESDKPGAFLASFSYLMVSAGAMIIFLAGVYGLYRLTGSLSYTGIAQGLGRLPDFGGPAAAVSLGGITAAVAIRAAIMPLYGWLPDAHALAPHSVSAVLSGVLIKTPLFALGRFLADIPQGGRMGAILSLAGGLTALGGVVLALCQRDAKRLLAYHSVSQIGYVVAAWGLALVRGLNTPQGQILMTGALIHALYHSWFKGVLFLTIGRVTDLTGERDVYVLRNAGKTLKDSGEIFPWTWVFYLAGALSITAIPPFSGYASKAFLSSGMEGQVQEILLMSAGAGTVASFLKLSRIFYPLSFPVFWPRRRKEKLTSPSKIAVTGDRPLSPQEKMAMGFLAMACVAGGLGAGPFRDFIFHLGGWSAVSQAWWNGKDLVKTLGTLVAGFLIFRWVTHPWGQTWTHRILKRPRSFEGLFTALGLGTLVLILWIQYP